MLFRSPDLIAQANIVVLPTFYGEGVPRILIEASASQRAIITTDMPGCRELVKPGVNGLLVQPQNVAELRHPLPPSLTHPPLPDPMRTPPPNIVEQATDYQIGVDFVQDVWDRHAKKVGK